MDWSLTPLEALAFFQAKGLQTTFNWTEMLGQEHRTAFTVAKLMDLELLEDVQESLTQAIADGTSFRDWAADIEPMLVRKGWWGVQDVVAPSGERVTAQLGSPARLDNIFRTNIASAYAEGRWEYMQTELEVFPYVTFDAIEDTRVRDEHLAKDGITVRKDSEWLRYNSPPLGYRCRCRLTEVTEEDAQEFGLTITNPETKFVEWTNPQTGQVEMVAEGVTRGFGEIPSTRHEKMAMLLQEKLGELN